MEYINLRELDKENDYPALAGLLNKVRRQKVTAELLRGWKGIAPLMSRSALPTPFQAAAGRPCRCGCLKIACPNGTGRGRGCA